jgi:hypothetical protein
MRQVGGVIGEKPSEPARPVGKRIDAPAGFVAVLYLRCVVSPYCGDPRPRAEEVKRNWDTKSHHLRKGEVHERETQREKWLQEVRPKDSAEPRWHGQDD